MFESICPSLQRKNADTYWAFESDANLPIFERGGKTKYFNRCKDMSTAFDILNTHMDAEMELGANVAGATFEWPIFEGSF